MKRTLLSISLCVVLTVMMIAGCAPAPNAAGGPSAQAAQENGSASSQGEGAAAVKDAVIFRIKAEPSSLDPHKTSGTGEAQIIQYQFYESLFREEKDCTVVNALAESHSFNADKTVLTCKLRQDVYFHNGGQMTADDVVFSLNRSMETGFNGVYVGAIDSVEKVDDFTVNIHLKYAYTPIVTCLSTLNTAIVPKSLVEADDDALMRSPVGTGAYRFVEWVAGDRIALDAFGDYWRGEAAIKHGQFKFIAENSTAMIALENGEIDVYANMSLSDIPLVDGNSNLKRSSSHSAALLWFAFNNQKGVFADVRMRKAVSMAVDREAYLYGVDDGYGTVTTACMLECLAEYPAGFEPDPYDIEAAKQLVIDAGYPNGVTVKVPTVDNQGYIKPTVMLQEELAKIGINLEIELMERAAWNERVLSNSDYEVTSWAIVITALDADFVASMFHSANVNGNGNFSQCAIPELDEVILKGRTLEPGEERNAVYREFCELIKEHCVGIPIDTNTREISSNAKLNGLQATPTQHYYFYDWNWAA